MTTDQLEQDVRLALGRQAARVPDHAADRIANLRYPVRRGHPGRVFAAAAATAGIAACGAVYVTGGTGSPRGSAPAARLHATPIAYVGTSPRLAVTRLPAGFKPGPDIPLPTLPGQPAPKGRLPARTFVSGTGAAQESIVLEEGTDGAGPVPKLLAFAAAHPAITSQQAVNGTTITIVDLPAAGAGSGYVLYWPVSSTSWALLGSSPGVTLDQLLTVVAGITSST
jgi:hypothetical protein